VTDDTIIPFKHPRSQLLKELMDADAQRAHELFVACPPESRADQPDLRHIHADLTSHFARYKGE
jgi:hypothetical protein